MRDINNLDENRSCMLRQLMATSTYNELFGMAICFLKAAHSVSERSSGGIDNDQFKTNIMRAIDIFIETGMITHGEVH